ncbi:MAG: ribosome recycling factor [Chlamydiota bacterium]
MNSVIENASKKMDSAIEHLKHELNGIRTGRANPSMLDNVMVEVYGTSMRVRDVATISSPEPRQLLITPFDPSSASSIGTSLEKENMGFQIVVDANAVRIIVPPMDENLRKEMVKQCKKKCEEAKISIRNIRRECNDYARKMKADGDLTEDDEKRLEKKIQELTDQYCKQIDELGQEKEAQVMEV